MSLVRDAMTERDKPSLSCDLIQSFYKDELGEHITIREQNAELVLHNDDYDSSTDQSIDEPSRVITVHAEVHAIPSKDFEKQTSSKEAGFRKDTYTKVSSLYDPESQSNILQKTRSKVSQVNDKLSLTSSELETRNSTQEKRKVTKCALPKVRQQRKQKQLNNGSRRVTKRKENSKTLKKKNTKEVNSESVLCSSLDDFVKYCENMRTISFETEDKRDTLREINNNHVMANEIERKKRPINCKFVYAFDRPLETIVDLNSIPNVTEFPKCPKCKFVFNTDF